MRMPPLFGLLCAAGLATAGQPTTPPVFSVHNLNRDGYLDQAEFAALQAACARRRGARCDATLETFESLDAEGDGRIGEDELLGALGRRQRGGRGY